MMAKLYLYPSSKPRSISLVPSSMSEKQAVDHVEVEGEEHDANYQPPPQKTIEEIMAADAEDESLRKYKEALLGEAQSEKIIFG